MLKRLLPLATAMLLCSSANAAKLTTYLTEWSGYSAGYSFDKSYPSAYGDTTLLRNQDMVTKVQASDVVEFAFLQVWNQDLINQYKTKGAKQVWLGVLHFDDLWGDLANSNVDDYVKWQNLCGSTTKAGALASGTCAAVQPDADNVLQILDYSTADKWTNPGQMDNFGAFLKLETKARKVISIGGANTPDNKSVSTQTFQTIFANQEAFLNSLAAFMTGMQNSDLGVVVDADTKLSVNNGFNKNSGVDYDFEPPINADGGQKTPDATTAQDYLNLYNLVKATRAKLGDDAYVSVTITVNADYLDAINKSVEGGWFKQIQASVNAINLMTYDLHGPWSLSTDPGAISHAMLKHPSNLTHSYAVNYATTEVTEKVLAYGIDPAKLQVGLASYGRGFAGVPAGSSSANPGFDQPWTGPSVVDAKYSNQNGMLPYKFVNDLVKSGYSHYDVLDTDSQIIASYIYSPSLRQLVGYMSPAVVDNTCAYIKSTGLQGAILWSADTDASYDGSQGTSLISEYSDKCRST